jgi:hypothetical protein
LHTTHHTAQTHAHHWAARQVELAKRLVTNSFADKAFFCNSGTEANEGAIKFARKYARVAAGVDPYDATVRCRVAGAGGGRCGGPTQQEPGLYWGVRVRQWCCCFAHVTRAARPPPPTPTPPSTPRTAN